MARAEGRHGPRATLATAGVVGTAGHIDHGKTALVRALTGVDTDRLAEEKRRGITIELGFAPLDLPGGLRLGVVDVPGHERLVRTMVAGACGIDLVLLVVAADEGVGPQTREHLAICELLGVERGVVALTKIDRAEPEVADLAEEEVRRLLAGSPLADAPVVRVSAVTGEGLERLREALAAAARAMRPRLREGPARLAVDRVFEARGFGPVVTGTLAGGPLALGEDVEILPERLRARIRGLQVHGRAAERVEPGTRCAVNLHGVEREQLARGQLLAHPGALEPTRVFDAEVRWLAAAPVAGDRVAAELLLGTAERRVRVAPVGAPRTLAGARQLARIRIEGAPVAAVTGERFVLRGFVRSSETGFTLGGGRVLDPAPAPRRRSDPLLRAELERIAAGGSLEAIAVHVERAGRAGVDAESLRRRCGLERGEFERGLERLRARGTLALTPGGRAVTEAALRRLEQGVVEALRAFHRREPLQPGLLAASLAGALGSGTLEEAAALAVERLEAAGRVVREGGHLRLPEHRPRASGEEERWLERLRRELKSSGLAPPTLREWAERLKAAPERLARLLVHLEREGEAVRAGADLWFAAEAVEELRRRVVEHLQRHGALETPAYKALIGATRRHAVPLMELLDAEQLTRRVGNRRVLHPRWAASRPSSPPQRLNGTHAPSRPDP